MPSKDEVKFTMISNESREMYSSLLELETLRLRIEKVRIVIGDLDHRSAIVGVY